LDIVEENEPGEIIGMFRIISEELSDCALALYNGIRHCTA